MQPTPLARSLQGPIKTALASVSLALALPQRFDPARARVNIRLGITDYVGLMMLPAVYATLAREAPGISLEVLPRPVEDSVSRIVSGEIDLAPIVDPPEGRDLFNEPLIEESFVCAMRAGHPLARARLTVARLLEHPHLAVTAHLGAAKLVDRVFADRGLRRRVPVSVAGFATRFSMLGDRRRAEIELARLDFARGNYNSVRSRLEPYADPEARLLVASSWVALDDAAQAETVLRELPSSPRTQLLQCWVAPARRPCCGARGADDAGGSRGRLTAHRPVVEERM